MKRNEYIDQLRDALAFLPEESRRAALGFYTEMLDDRMEDGMDEESAVCAMEAPADIAAWLKAEGMEEIAAASPLHVGIRDEALEFASLADSALQGVENAMRETAAPRETEEKEEEAKPEKPAETSGEGRASAGAPEGGKTGWAWDSGWQDAVGGALEAASKALEKAGKTLGSILSDQAQTGKNGENNSEYERKEITCPAEAIDAVRLTVSNMPIAVKAAEGNDVTLVYYTSEQHPYRAAVENGALTLRSEERENARGFHFSFFNDGVKLFLNQPSPTVELFLPSGALLDLKAQTGNGSIRLEEVRGLCDVELETSNSRISVRQVTVKSLEARTSNSRLVLEDVESKQTIRGKTSNARIEASGVKAGGEIILNASNGRISLDRVAAAGALSAITSNSSIQVERVAAASVTLHSSNGGIRGVLPGRQADWAITSGTSNGKNSLPRQQAGGRPLDVRTSNASIDIRFEEG